MQASVDLIVFYVRETGFPLALLAGDKVCRYGDPQYTIEDFKAELEAEGRKLKLFILVDLTDAFELDEMLEQLATGDFTHVSYMGPFPMSMLGGEIPGQFVDKDDPGSLPN